MFRAQFIERIYIYIYILCCIGKGKVVFVLFLTELHAMKAYWGVEV
jgi:hypothetical protein